MKRNVLLSIICLLTFVAKAQIFDVDTIQYSGDDSKFINLVIMGDGYRASEFSKLTTDANDFTVAFFNKAPFTQYQSYFNVFLIKTPSNESGADHAGTGSDVIEPQHAVASFDTYFDAQFDSFGFHRLLTVNNTTAINVLADNVPSYDQAIMLVNTPFYGGSGGEIPVASTELFGKEVALHELGHSFTGLKDEYWAGNSFAAEGINMTQESNPSKVKWKNWDGYTGVGTYQHCCDVDAASWYKPHQFCIMQTLLNPFCSVCIEGIIETIHDLTDPVESIVPENATNFVPNSFPVDFSLNLIIPNPNSLKISWMLNGNPYGGDTDTISIAENDLLSGANTLVASVIDETTLLRIDNHATVHFTTVSWTIDNSTLGIEDITANENKFELQLYPNPVGDQLNILIESILQENLYVELFSLDGKRLKRTAIEIDRPSTIDLSDVVPGTYMLNVYSEHGKLASKKIIKS